MIYVDVDIMICALFSCNFASSGLQIVRENTERGMNQYFKLTLTFHFIFLFLYATIIHETRVCMRLW